MTRIDDRHARTRIAAKAAAVAAVAAVLLVLGYAGARRAPDAPPPAAAAVAPTPTPPPATIRTLALWPAGSLPLQQAERELTGKPNAIVQPTMIVYPPTAPSVRTAVLVFPGGGFKAVAVGPDSTLGPDGADVCAWLGGAGITCVLVKYRVPNTGCNWNRDTRRHDQPAIPMALQDAQRALALVRAQAAAFGVDADRIGVMGFSAGGNLAVLSSTHFGERAYARLDARDDVPLRPDFAIPVYPGHLTMEHKNVEPRELAAQQLNTDIVVSAAVPPTLLVHARDDDVDPVHYSQVYARELRAAGVDVTLNLYATGGHAFGVHDQGRDTDRWRGDALDWLRAHGFR